MVVYTGARTRAQVVDFAKVLLDEKGSLYFTDANLATLADQANRMVWRLVIDSNPEHFLTSKSFTWASGVEAQTVTTLTDNSTVPYRILTLEDYESSGGVSNSNLPRKWAAMAFSDRSKRLQGNSHLVGSRSTPRYYVLQGAKLYTAPLPDRALNVTMYYIEHLPTMAGDSTEVLGGLATEFHDAVGYCLAWMMNAKQNNQNPAIDNMWEMAKLQIKEHGYTRNAEEPRSVRVLGHY